MNTLIRSIIKKSIASRLAGKSVSGFLTRGVRVFPLLVILTLGVSLFSSEAFAFQIERVIRGTAQLVGGTDEAKVIYLGAGVDSGGLVGLNILGTPQDNLDVDKSLLIFKVSCNSTSRQVVDLSGSVDDPTHLLFTRRASTTTANVEFMVIEFSSGARVISGMTTIPESSTSKTITVSSVDTTKSVVLLSSRAWTTADNGDEFNIFGARLTSSTQLLIQRAETGAGYNNDLAYQILAFDSTEADVSVINGQVDIDNSGAADPGETSDNGTVLQVPVSPAVDASRSLLLFTILPSSGVNGREERYAVDGTMSDAGDSLTFTRRVNSGTVSVWYSILKFNNNVFTQKGRTALTGAPAFTVFTADNSNGFTTSTYAARSIGVFSVSGGAAGVNTSLDEINFRAQLNSVGTPAASSTYTLTRETATTSTPASISWFIAEFPPLNITRPNGGEDPWFVGETNRSITWEHSKDLETGGTFGGANGPVKVKLLLDTNSGKGVDGIAGTNDDYPLTITTGLSAMANSYPWPTIPATLNPGGVNIIGNKLRVRIQCEEVYVGTPVTVNTSTNSGGLILITTAVAHNLYTGNRVKIEGHSLAAVNRDWVITRTGANTFTLNGSTYVSNGNSGTVTENKRNYDDSNGDFEIKGAIANLTLVSTPWKCGDANRQIKWTPKGNLNAAAAGTVKIELSMDNGLTWDALNAGVAAGTDNVEQTWNWNPVPSSVNAKNVIGDDNKIRVTLNSAAAALNISSSTDTTPIKIVTAASHHLYTGDLIVVAGHNKASVNGSWIITKIDATSFTLNGSVMHGTGSGSASGTVTQNIDLLVSAQSDAFTIRGDISAIIRNPATTWLLGQPITISWSKKGYFGSGVTDGFVKVYYSPTGVAPWTELTNLSGLSAYPVPAGTDASGGSVNWAIPFSTAISNAVSRIKIEQATDDEVSAETGDFLLKASLSLIAPVGGEKWKIGESHDIQWTPHGDLGDVIIKYAYNDDWGNATVIATRPGGTAEAPQTYPWSVNNPIGLNAKLRIYKADDANIYVESGTFDLKPVLTVSTPGAGDTVKVTDSVESIKQTVLWTFVGGITGKADIALSSDVSGDSFPTVLSSNTEDINSLGGGSGSYSWTVLPGHIGTQRVRVSWHADADTTLATGSCASSGVFKTVAYLKYTAPNTANQTYNIGDQVFVKWTPYPANNTWKVGIRYSTASGGAGTYTGFIADNVDANYVPSGETDIGYKWAIPDVSGIIKDSLRIQVYQEGKKDDVHSEGNFDFTVKGTIALTNAANGVGSPTWLIGVQNNITFDVVGDVGNVNVLISENGTDFNATPIVTGFTVDGTGSYSCPWTIPTTAISGDRNTDIKFKVTNTLGTDSLPSANPITIQARITNVTPASGTTLLVADTDNPADTSVIGWKSYYHGNIPDIKLKLYNPATSDWEDINNGDSLSNSLDDMTYGLWQVPNAVGDTALVKVYSASSNGGAVYADSATTFKIKPKFRIDAPTSANTGVNALKVNSVDMPASYTVRWKNCGDVASAKLYFSANGGAYQEVGDVVGTNGVQSFNWQPPATWNVANTIGTTNKLKLANPLDPTVVYKESQNFEIKGQLGILTPNGETYAIGPTNYIDITWKYAGDLGNIEIWFSPDGTNWELKDTVDVGHVQPYPLLVPDAPTISARIKLIQVTDVTVVSTSIPFRIRGNLTNAQVLNTPWKVNGNNNRITWDRTGAIAEVKIDLNTGSGYNYNIASNLANTGELLWSIPAGDYATVTSETCRIRIQDQGDQTVETTTLSDFAIKPVVWITHPEGMTDSWEIGTVHNIQWDYLGALTNVKLRFSDDNGDNGGTWPGTSPYLIVADTDATTKSFPTWTVPDKMSNQCFMRISKVGDPTVTDNSNSAFAIKAKVAITQPLGGAIRANSSYDIKWNTTGTLKPLGTVKLEFALDGSNFVAISGAGSKASPEGETTYSWSVPDSSSAQAKVRVVSNDEASIKSESNFFSLRKLSLLAPNGNEHWEVHTPQTITWQAEEVGTVRAYYTINGTDWILIPGTAAGSAGSMSWTMADDQMVSQNCKVRIEDLNYSTTIYDTSDLPFDIKAYLRVTAPVGGTPVVATEPYSITWDSYGDGVSDVILEYYNSTNTTWYYVNPVSPYKVPNSIGSGITKLFAFPVDSLADSAKIRITDPNNSNATNTGSNFWIKGEITVSAPAGAESWNVDTKHNIVWTTKGDIALVNIYYSPDNGNAGTWAPIGTNITGNLPSWEWNILPATELTDNKGKIKVTDAGHDLNVFDVSSNTFTIKGSIYNVTVDGGPTYVYTGTSTITTHWEYYGAISTVEIYYAADGTNFLTKLGEEAATNRQATVTIPNSMSSIGKIRVQDKANPSGVGAVIAAPITIKGSIAVNDITGSTVWVVGSKNDIKWTPTGTYTNDVKLEYVVGGALRAPVIGTAAPGISGIQQTFPQWTTPDDISDQVKIRVSTQENNAAIDVVGESAVFKIRGDITAVTAPTTGTVWNVGDATKSIVWTKVGTVTPVKIEFYDGVSTSTLVGSYDVGSGSSWPWPAIPNVKAEDCTVTITDTRAASVTKTSNAFAIRPVITATAPATVRAAQSAGVNWSITGSPCKVSKVKLQQNVDGAGYVDILTDIDASSGSGTISWSVPAQTSTNTYVRVIDQDNSSIYGTSAKITIAGYLTIDALSSTSWDIGSTQTIAWHAKGISRVITYYSLNGVDGWTPIQNGASGEADGEIPPGSGLGSATWTIPETINVTQTGKIKIVDKADPTVTYAISPETVHLLAAFSNILPSGGLPVQAKEQYEITWYTKGSGVSKVLLEYKDETGWHNVLSSGDHLVNNVQGANSYVWQPYVPEDALSDAAQIRITDPGNSQATATGTNFWIKGDISVTVPSGVESWEVGTDQIVNWTEKGSIPTVKIYYSPDAAGENWKLLGSTLGTDLHYDWSISPTETLSTTARIKVTDATKPAYELIVKDVSDGAFTVKGRIFGVTTDSGPVYVYTGSSTITVHWDYYGSVQTFEIYYAANGVDFLTKLGEVAAPLKQATVTIPNAMSSIGKIRVQDKANPSSVGAVIAAPITIKGSIAVNDITTSTVWVVGSKNDIKWTPTGTYTNDVKLEYVVAGTVRTPVIATAAAGASGIQQTFPQWTTPDDISDQVKIRVSTQENNAAIDVVGESAVFKIRGDITAVTAPTTGTVWNVGDATKSIVWTKVGTVTPVKIELYDGTSTSTLVASYDAGAGNSWPWPAIPNVKAEDCTVTVSDARAAFTSSVTKTSNAFAIRPVITVTAPGTVRAAQSTGVNWSITGSPCKVSKVKLQQNVDGAGYVDVLTDIDASSGSGTISWSVPVQTSTNTYVRVIDQDNSNIYGTSAKITIAGYLTIDALSSTNWNIGSTQTIAWHAKGISKVLSYYSLNGVDGWTAAGAEADGETPAGSGLGSVQWTIPETVNVSQAAKIKIVDKADPTVTYAISPETVHLLAAFSNIIPSGGLPVQAKDQFEITWYTKGSGVPKVLLEYKDETGWHNVLSSGDHLVNNVQGANSYVWQPYVPEDALSDAAQLRITDPGNSQATTTGTNFWIKSDITVTVPSGVESWEVGTDQIVNWTEKGSIPTVKIYYSPDAAGENWKLLGSTLGTDLHYDWSINPLETLSTTARIKVTDATKPAYESIIKSVSPGVFTVKGRIFGVTTDNGPTYVYTGSSTITVHWDYYGAVQIVEIYYAANGTNFLTKLGEATASDKQATFTIPNSMSSVGKIRVQDKANPSSVGAVIAAPITIKGSIAVNDITGSTVWVVGSKNDIKWTPTGTYTNDVKIEYVVGGTVRAPVIATAAAGASGVQQTFPQWTTPDDISDQVKIRVSTQENNALIDVVGESAVFKIRGDITVVTAPTTGTVWNVGDATKSIVWTKVGTVTPVKIEFYNGVSTSTLIASYDVGAGNSWPWPAIPNVKAEDCTVTVSDARAAFTSSVTKTSAAFAIRPVITITVPATVSAAQSVGVQWSITGSPCKVSKVKLQQNTDGAGYVDILTDIDASSGSGTISWSVPAQKSTNTYVRVIDQDNSNIYGTSAKITIVGYLLLLSPNGTPVQEHWQVGTTQSISWSSSAISSVKAYYSYNGTDWPLIGQGSGNSMNWAIPSDLPVSNNVRVKVTDAESEDVNDVSDQPFEIIAVFDLQHPENGDTLTAETPYLIQWDKNKSTGVSKVYLEYSTQGGAVGTWNFVNALGDNSVPNDGFYSWNPVPANALSMNCKMRVRDFNNTLAVDTGAGQFRIKSSLTLTSPTVGNESWGAGTPHDITWTKKGDISTIQIEYSPNEGLPGSWLPAIATSVPAVGVPSGSLKYTWNIPDTITLTTKGRIKITVEGVESDVTSESTNDFEIKGTLTLTTPDAAGISLPVNTPYDITWSQFGAISTVQIFLSTDGSSYPVSPFIEVPVSGPTGSYSWQPDINSISKTCRIKIVDKNNTTVKDESTNVFEIKGKVALNNPSSTGIKWFYNEAAQIRWTPTGNYSQVKLEYSLDNFATAGTPIATVDAGASGVMQTYDWNQVTIPIAETARIRVSDPNSPTVQATSANDFSVRGRLRLIIPNGTETWTVGTKHFITWSTLNGASIPKVDLSYSVNAGSFTEIVANFDNSGSYEWNIPTNMIISDNVVVKVADHRYPDDTSVSDVSDAPFKTVAGITLIAPVGSASEWGVGTDQNITWTPQGDIPLVDITYTDGITPSIPIVTNWNGNSGSYPWHIPNNPNITSKVKVMDIRKPDTVFAVSPENFSIVGSLTVLTPAVGGSWIVGNQKEITWSTNGTSIPRVKILLSLDGGGSWEQITDNGAGGSLFWNVPEDKCSPQARIKIIDYSNPRVLNEMAGNFKLQPQFNVTSPSAGQMYGVSDNVPIVWQTQKGVVTTVKIQYRKSGSDPWVSIRDSLGNSGNLDWPADDAISATVVIRVCDTRDESAFADSGVFVIHGKVALQGITTGTVWIAETPVTVNWTKTGTIAQVDLAYSATGGEPYPTSIANGVTATDGSKAWTAPVHVTSSARVKISETGGSSVVKDESAVFTVRGSVTVTAPNGPAAQWLAGTPHNITWNRTGDFANVKIALSATGGEPYNTSIVDSWAAAGGTYPWGIPADFPLGIQYKVKIYDAADQSNVFDSSDANFAIIGSLTLVTPNLGGTWYVDESQNIEWTRNGGIAYVGIDLSTNGFSDESETHSIIAQTDATGTPPNSYRYTWPAVGNYIGTNTKIRVKDYSNPDNVYSISAVPFTIKGSLTLTYPNGGTTLIAGDPLVVQWTPHGTIPTVKLEYSTTGGEPYSSTLVASTDGMTGSCATTVPSVIGSLVRIKVSDTQANRSRSDDSDANFEVKGKLTLTSPITRVSWQVGTVHNVTWDVKGPIQNVRIQYATDGNWATAPDVIASTNAQTGTYPWTIPPVISGTVKVKITDTLDSSVTSTSPVDFKLVGVVTVSEPTAASRWEIGVPTNITWTKTGPIDNVMIDLSKDGGSTWTNILGPLGGTTTSYTPVNGDVTYRSVIRVRDATDTEVFALSPQFHIKARFIITAPNGDVWPVQSPQTIIWNTIGTVPTVVIEYSKDNGDHWTTITGSTSNNNNYPWTVPNAVSSACFVRVSDINDAEAVGISSQFKIRGDITLSQPSAAGISWVVDSAQQIKFNITGSMDKVTILYSTTGVFTPVAPGITINNDVSVVEGQNIYSWTVPDTLSKTCKVKVLCNDDNLVFATSANDFAIAGQLGITQPTTGTVWRVNGTGNIQWQRLHGNIQYVNIVYSTNGTAGPFDQTIATNVLASLGTYPCSVADTVSETVVVKVYDRDNTDVSVLSNQFSIKGRLALTRPVTSSERFIYGTNENITWNKYGSISTVTLEYTLDDGGHYTLINNAVSANASPWPWSVPNEHSNNVKIRISDNGDPSNVYDMSPQPFKIIGTLTLISPGPAGGEVWPVASTQTITWSVGGSKVARIKIEYSLDGGASYPFVIANDIASGPTVSVNYTIPEDTDLSQQVVVKVSDMDAWSNVFATSSMSNKIKIRGDLVVTRPSLGEAFLLLAGEDIRWTRLGKILAVNIDYSTDGSFSVPTTTRLVSNRAHVVGNNQSYTWNPVPNPPTTTAKIRIYDANDTTVYATSQQFTIRGGFRITAPNGGESWAVGSLQQLEWETFGTYANVKIDYSVNGGSNWTTLINNTPNTPPYPWTVANAISEQCRIRVIAIEDTNALDISDANFKIHGVLTLQSPVGGENWGVGTSQNITWAKTGTIPTVKLEYSTNAFDDESQVFPIASNVPSTNPVNSYSWGVPDKIGTRLKVRVSVSDDPNVNSVSPSTFTIRGTIIVGSPNGAVSWIAKSVHDISWTTQGNITKVDLEYSTDSGAHYTYIVQNIANTSPYSWTLPDVISKTCRVRISDHSDPLANDTSDIDFYIRGDLQLTSPMGGEKWAVGTTQDITWNTTGPVGNVGLEYSINGGISYLTIVASVSNTSHYTWTVPTNLTTHAKVRVYDTTDTGVNTVTPGEFKIQGSFTITTPNGGEPWDAANSYDIVWTSNPTAALMPFVDIDYTKDNGSHWFEIARSAPNNGRYSWFIPVEAVSTTVKVKIASAADGEAKDESDSTFYIRCNFVLTFPNNLNEQLRVGRTYNIAWNQVGTPDHGVTLQYAADNFLNPANTHTIATNVAAPLSSNTYPWTVPNFICNTAKIRIFDSDDQNAKDVSDNNFRITADVRVDSPNGAENWEYNTIQTIQWTTFGTVANVKIEYSTDGGVSYTLIKAVPNATPPTSTTTWTIPDEVSDGCKIRVSDASDSTADDVSDANFNIIPGYAVTAPNTGSEDWTVGDHHDITWTCTATVANARLDYSTNSGTNYNNVIIASTANAPKGGTRTFDWTVPNAISKTVRVRVGSATSPAAFDASDNDFRIRGALRITAPNGGQSLQISQPYAITWVTTGTIPNVQLLYSIDGSTYPFEIVHSTANSSPYNWTVPDRRTPTAKIRIVDAVNSDVMDDSDANFRIQGYLSLNAPNGGEDWLSGDHHNISWDWGGTMPNVKLLLDTNSGKGADNIAGTADDYPYVINALAPNGAGPGGTHTYDWAVANTLSHNCRVKVEDTADDEVFDASSVDFRINGQIVVTSPVGGERWVTNETHSITWTNRGSIPNVRIIYSKDNFTTFDTVVASVANTNSYPWVIPDDRSNTVKVRVLDVNDATISGTSPADFRIDYYNISWDVRDLLTNERLTNLSVSEKVTGGTFVGWQAVGLTAPLVHATPYGFWTTVWSATGFGDKGQNFTADHDQSFTVYLETSAVHIWRSSAEFTYDAVGDNLKVTAWLERDGSVVQGAAKIGIYIYDDTGSPLVYNAVCDPQYYNFDSNADGEKDQCNPRPTLFSTTIDPSGYFYMTFPAPTGLQPGKVYAALVDIMNLSGAHFKTPTSFSITESKQLQTTEAAVQEMKNVTLPGFQTGVQNTINTGIETQKQMITDIMVGTGGDPATIMANGGMVGIIQSSMTSFETSTTEAIKKLQTGAETAVAAGEQLQSTAKRFSWNGNVAPDPALTGDTITLQIQGQPSLMPLASIYTWDNKPVVESVILTETRPGFYVYSFLADARFTPGKAYTFMVTEQVTGGLISGSGMVESMGITTVAGLAAAAPEAERAAKKALEAIKAVESVLVSNENINISMTLKNLKESVDALPATISKEGGGNAQMMNAINDISARLTKMMGAEGMDFSSLLDEKLGDTSSMKQLRNKTDTISAIVDLLLQIMESKLGGVDSPIVSTSLQSGSVKFRIMAINPSKTKVQKVQVKKYLPEEVKPKDVMDLGGLDLEYDSEKGIYYVYKNDLDMQPNQVNVFEVEVEDIWMIPDNQIAELKKRTDEILALFEKTPMYNTAKEVTDTIYPVLAEIPKAQTDDTVSREQHIGIYRQNQQNIKAINEKLAELEKMLAPEKGKPTPNILERNKLKVNLPSKSTTWLIILVVIIFLGVFAGIFFFVWQGQIKSSQDLIKDAAKSSFPGQKPEDKSAPPK